MSHRRGLTLVELLVAVSIIGVLMSLLLPAIQAAREAARRSHCANNLHNQALAVNAYVEQRRGALPALWRTARPRPWDNFSWRVTVTPYLEARQVFDALELAELPLDDRKNREVLATALAPFACPSAPGFLRRIDEMGFAESRHTELNVTAHDYVGVHDVSVEEQQFPWRGAFNGGPDLQSTSPAYSGDPPANIDRLSPTLRTMPGNVNMIGDGLSNTALLVEQAGKPLKYGPASIADESEPSEGPWGTADFSSFSEPSVNRDNYSGVYGFHFGANVAMCDGSVHLWSPGMAGEVLVALLSRDAEEIVDARDWQP